MSRSTTFSQYVAILFLSIHNNSITGPSSGCCCHSFVISRHFFPRMMVITTTSSTTFSLFANTDDDADETINEEEQVAAAAPAAVSGVGARTTTTTTTSGGHSSTISGGIASELDSNAIRFLGKGPNALVREGVVLIAPTEEYNHYLMRASIYVYAMGLDEYNEQVIRCVVLDNPTPFTMGEMTNRQNGSESSSSSSSSSPLLEQNLLYRGGNLGGETAMMLHSVKELGREEIGCSGIYQGGFEQALEWVADSSTAASTSTSSSLSLSRAQQFKFFFNYCQFSPFELEGMLETVDGETGDAWMSVEVPPEVVLAEWDKNECWRYLRKVLRKRNEASAASTNEQ